MRHCEREIEFLDRLAAAEPRVRVQRFEIIRNRENRELLVRVGKIVDELLLAHLEYPHVQMMRTRSVSR